ncbi:MAG: ParB/RepB/Spo0J family partition protein [Clostridia bacterium]|nr:ParB/RepB/Spo0J family partition protein [Clostridia bacterium]MBQ9924691.1 ParB/RepB/Spo0J family partition protein [Clostridia bacterium]
MTSGKGLGKGLSALFGEEFNDETQLNAIKLRDIEPNPNQPRREFDPVALEELAESIRQNGIITPITVRKAGESYQIIAGERRWRAARMAGLDEIPAYVLDVDEREAYQYALVENLQRQDLNPIEEALGYQRLMEDYGYSQEKAGEKVGRSRSYIANALRLLTLPQIITDMIASGALSAGHGRALVVLDEQKAMEAAKSILEKELSVRETEKLVKRLLEEVPDEAEEKKEDTVAMYVRELERNLASSTGHKVTIKHGRKKGKLTIEYYGNDDLDKICAALNKIEKE